jgi:hypothetical protein
MITPSLFQGVKTIGAYMYVHVREKYLKFFLHYLSRG